jgi:hypothetical protein
MKTKVVQLLCDAAKHTRNIAELARVLEVEQGTVYRWMSGSRGKGMNRFTEKHLVSDLEHFLSTKTDDQLSKPSKCEHHKDAESKCYKLCDEIMQRWKDSDDGGRDMIRGMLAALCPRTAQEILQHLDHVCPSRHTKKKSRGNTRAHGGGTTEKVAA